MQPPLTRRRRRRQQAAARRLACNACRCPACRSSAWLFCQKACWRAAALTASRSSLHGGQTGAGSLHAAWQVREGKRRLVSCMHVACVGMQWVRFALCFPYIIAAGTQACSNADEPPAPAMSARIKLFEQQAAAASAAGVTGKPAAGGGGWGHANGSSSSSSGGSSGPHEGCIVSISPLPSERSGSLGFVTASLEGCIAEWHVDPASL